MKLRSLALLGTLGSFIFSLLATGAWAQDGDGRLEIEEIVVTGTKREVSQQDLGMSVSTLTDKQIKNSFSTDITAVTQLAPNVNILQQNGFNAVGGGTILYSGHFPRFHPSDFRVKSLDGVADDWPINYSDLAPHYTALEKRLKIYGNIDKLEQTFIEQNIDKEITIVEGNQPYYNYFILGE